MSLAERQPAAREAATAVPVMERATQGRRNRAGPGAHLHQAAVNIVPHDDPARVARQALRRFRGNARAAFQDRLAGRVRVRQHRRVDVDDDLIALTRGAGIDPAVERRLRDQRQCVGLLLWGAPLV